MIIDNIWPELEQTELTPTLFLEELAHLLKEKYDGKLIAKIVTSYPEDTTTITVAFYLVHTQLKGYNYRLLWFNQGIDEVFPFIIQAFSNPTEKFKKVNNVEEFKNTVTEIIGSKRSKDILNNLLTIGNSVKVNDED